MPDHVAPRHQQGRLEAVHAEGSWFYEIIAPGYKYNMTDIAAAMGIVQLRKAERMRARRAEIARHVQCSVFGDSST